MTEVFGYGCCRECQAPVLAEILWKTGGRCADCFRARTGPLFDEIIAVTEDRERIRLRLSRRTPGDRAQRRRANQRRRTRDDVREHNRLTALASTRAKAKLARIFGDVYEAILADERDKLGLEPWTLDRVLTPHQLTDETMARLAWEHSVDQKADRC